MPKKSSKTVSKNLHSAAKKMGYEAFQKAMNQNMGMEPGGKRAKRK